MKAAIGNGIFNFKFLRKIPQLWIKIGCISGFGWLDFLSIRVHYQKTSIILLLRIGPN